MRIRIVVASLTLSLAALACAAQPAEPERPEAPPAPPTAPAQPARPSGSAGGGGTNSFESDAAEALAQRQAELEQRAAEAAQRAAEAADRHVEAADRRFEAAARSTGLREWEPFTLLAGGPSPDRAVVITTEPITGEIEDELKEDLGVMHKLLGDATSRAGGGDTAPRAMGIKLSSLAMEEPTYIEGLGAIFNYRVAIPLAGGAGGTGATTKPERPSAWETAKREINARRNSGGGFVAVKMKSAAEIAPFDPAKVEELTRAVVKTLPEAKNIRHLKDDDVVIVTFSGTDDAGKPMRMTLKAQKSHIEQAASGALTPEAFAERVARRIG